MYRCLAKYFLFAVNLILTLFGLLLLGLGILIAIKYKDLHYEQFGIELDIDFMPISLITLGIVVSLVAFSGCCGAITESKCMLLTYAVLMGILAAAKIGFTIFLFVNMSKYKNDVQRWIDQNFVADDSPQNLSFHVLEATFKCCGTTGPDSYINDYNLTSPTCCEKFNKDPTTTEDANRICTKDEAYPVGCTKYIGNTLYNALRKLALVMIACIVYEVLTMILAIYIVATIQPKVVNTVYYHY